MNEKRFEELFTDVERWILKSRRLKFAGDAYIGQIMVLINQHLAIQPLWQIPQMDGHTDAVYRDEDLLKIRILIEQWSSLSDARALLYGLAIENACKAWLIAKREITIEHGKVKGLRTDHNILAMVKSTDYRPTKEEINFLELLGYQLRVLSKYPIAKDLKTQNQFTGRALGARVEDGILTENLILSVLKEEALIKIFKEGKN